MTKRSRHIIAIILSTTLAVAGLQSTARAAETSSHGPYRDYLQANTGPGTSALTDEDQCGLPVTARAGAWMCYGTATDLAELRRKLTRMGILHQRDAAATPQEYCPHQGACWTQYSVTDSDFAGTGIYGYGSTGLGTAELYFEVKMNGAQTISKPVYFSSTRGIKSLTMEGERLYLSSAHPDGRPVSPSTYSPYGPINNIGAGVKTYWRPNGYKSYENTTAWATVVHEATWTDPSSQYPGRWYYFAKCIKLKRQSSGAYYFQGSSALPASPDRGAWTQV